MEREIAKALQEYAADPTHKTPNPSSVWIDSAAWIAARIGEVEAQKWHDEADKLVEALWTLLHQATRGDPKGGGCVERDYAHTVAWTYICRFGHPKRR